MQIFILINSYDEMLNDEGYLYCVSTSEDLYKSCMKSEIVC